MDKAIIRMSVRAVVETTLHESDLSPAGSAMQQMREGTAAHKRRQSSSGEATYRAEVALAGEYEDETLTLRVTGRADGIFVGAQGETVIEEIKLGAEGNELIPAHWAQAMMYGHMLCAKEGQNGAAIRVLYVSAHGEPLAMYEKWQDAEALAAEFERLCKPAAREQTRQLRRRNARDEALAQLAFPYDEYRAGQQKFARNVYIAIKTRKRLFAQAPTGIGKTVAALYPALRAIGEGKAARALFLTARTTGRRSAMDAMRLLNQKGAQTVTVELTAKDKVCMLDMRDCRPENCPYAKGFYDRLPEALAKAEGGLLFSQKEIEALAQEYTLCPYELSLELAMRADVVVCDSNYVFDPLVAIDRLMQGGAALLVDEAHQLSGRVRDNYSATLELRSLGELRRQIGEKYGRKGTLYKAFRPVVRGLRELAKTEAFASGRLDAVPEALNEAIAAAQEAASQTLSEGGDGLAAQALALFAQWSFVSGRLCDRYAILCEGGERNGSLSLSLLCADQEILERTKRSRGTVFFSATLAPFNAAMQTLGSAEGDAALLLPSPFAPDQLDVRIAPLDIRYACREETAPEVAGAIVVQLRAHPGNAMVFFPSYAYLDRIWELALGTEDFPRGNILREARGLGEQTRGEMLDCFVRAQGDTVLFAVLGGAFAEGIDLPGAQLTSVIVVSTGMPTPDSRVRAMQAYFDERGYDGFALCMTIPGMVRVIQAAGRLIRTQTDTGSLLLIDQRFNTPRIRRLMEGTLMGAALDAQNADA